MAEKCGVSVNSWHHKMAWLVLFEQSKSVIKVTSKKTSLDDKPHLFSTQVAEESCAGTGSLHCQIGC